jgi:hypothetical protein
LEIERLKDERCSFTFRDGRRCRMLRAPEHPTLCLHHARMEALKAGLLPAERPDLVAVCRLDNPWAVRRTLKRIFGEVAAGRVDPDQAHAMAHLGHLLLVRTRRTPRKRASRATERPA